MMKNGFGIFKQEQFLERKLEKKCRYIVLPIILVAACFLSSMAFAFTQQVTVQEDLTLNSSSTGFAANFKWGHTSLQRTWYHYSSGNHQASSSYDTNSSIRFWLSIVNATISQLEWEPGCTPIMTKGGASANLNCQNTGNGNSRCYLNSPGKDPEYLRTPPYSNPTAIFYVTQKSNGKYHISCSYHWNMSSSQYQPHKSGVGKLHK